MNVSEELRSHVADRSIPDKNRIIRTRELTSELTGRIGNSVTRTRVCQSLNDAYLNLQLATIADDGRLIDRCHRDCLALIDRIEREYPEYPLDAQHPHH
jgi:hypothetical protein